MPTPTTTREALARLRSEHVNLELVSCMEGAVIACLATALDIHESEVMLGFVFDVREVAMRAIALAVQGHVLAMAEDARG